MKQRASTVKVLAITNDQNSILKRQSMNLTNQIFRLTGVKNAFEKRKAFRHYSMKKKMSKSFSTPALKSSINLKKNTKNPLFQIPKKTMDWDQFLKSNSKIGNKMVYSQPSASLQEKITFVDKKIDKY